MGGDSAPETVLAGTMLALEEIPDLRPVLVGDSSLIKARMNDLKFPRNAAEIVHSSQVVSMSDPPTITAKKKKDSSINVALTLHRMGKVKAVVGAGNTGAQVVSSMLRLGMIEGVLRPVIGTLFPVKEGRVMLLDVGANTDCRAIHLLQFGIMGAIFMQILAGVDNPRVGLLSIGSEKTKGNEVSLFAYYLFEESHLNFIGNVEGSEILSGKVDIAVCDGFVGNLLLKFAESFPEFLMSQAEHMVENCDTGGLQDFLKTKFNPDFYGGVPILGVKGVSVVCHGASTPRAIANGIKEAVKMSGKNLNNIIAEQMSEIHRFYTMNKYFTSLRKRWENRRESMFSGTAGFFNWLADKEKNE